MDLGRDVHYSLHKQMETFRLAQRAVTDEERVRAEANLSKERLVYRRVVDEALKTQTLVVA